MNETAKVKYSKIEINDKSSVSPRRNMKIDFQKLPEHKSKFGFFEVFNSISKNLKTEKKVSKIENKICFPIIETIIIDNGQYAFWLFTDRERGLVLKKSSKKLTKEYIFHYFIRKITIHLKGYLKVEKSEKEILNDMNNYLLFSEHKESLNQIFTGDYKYLADINRIKFIYLKCNDNVDYFFNMIEFIRFINEPNKFNSLLLIQNFININQNCKPLNVHFTRDDLLSPKKYSIYTLRPKPPDQANIHRRIKEEDEEEAKKRRKKESLIENYMLLNNNTLLDEIQKMCDVFILYVEKHFHFHIKKFVLKLVKSLDDRYYYVWGENLRFEAKEDYIGTNDPEQTKIVPIESPSPKHQLRRVSVTNSKSCFGEFCEFIVPKFFKNLKKNQKAEENLKVMVSESKRVVLPNLVPVTMVKKAYDNPSLVDVVLKAYSIFPPNFDKDNPALRNQTQKIVLYTPQKDKFSVLNPDFLYSKKLVCNNCYVIYLLIHNFLSNIDENTASFKSMTKAKNILMQGDKLKNPFLNDDSFEQPQDNLLLQEEKKNFSLKNIIKKRNLKEARIKESKATSKNKKFKERLKSKVSAKQENAEKFSYKIHINSKLLKLNLVAEKANNKFFNLIFNKLSNEPETIYSRLGIKEPLKTSKKSMTNLRLHMGLNTNSNKINQKQFLSQKWQDELKAQIIRKSKNDSIEKEQIIQDIDIFITYKHFIKNPTQMNNSPILSKKMINSPKKSQDEKDHTYSDLEGKLSKISEFDMDEPRTSKSESYIESDSSSLNNSVLNDFNSKTKKAKKSKDMNSIDLDEVRDDFKKINSIQGKKLNDQDLKSFKVEVIDFSRDSNHNRSFEGLKKKVSTVVKNKANQSFDERNLASRLRLYTSENEDRRKTALSEVKDFHEFVNSKIGIKSIESKKITVNSIFYYEWSRDSSKNAIPYYYISTPLTKFNEINLPVQENPYALCKNMTIEDYCKIGKFEYSPLLESYKVFVYDQFTAIPYRTFDFKSTNVRMGQRDSLIKRLLKNEPNSMVNEKRRLSIKTVSNKKPNLLVIFINDFFDSFNKYIDIAVKSLNLYGSGFENFKMACFNLPGQALTIFPKKSTFNNLYYNEFFDRFLFNLAENNVFDHTYNIMLVGFGNGGQIALSYVSNYEKYWDFIHSIVLFNTYIENDDFMNKSMLEILKIVETSKNPKLVDFFYKSITVSPQRLLELDQNFNQETYESDDKLNENFNSPNNITMSGFYNITKGFFFNVKANYNEIKTPIVVVHSNQNCFITINNINPLFKHTNNSNSIGESLKNGENINFEEINTTNQIRRKLLVVDGSHDIIKEDSDYVCSILSSYFNYLLKNSLIHAKKY